jgi:FKBP-type peptidyl-prolyl cis-trans isomerase
MSVNEKYPDISTKRSQRIAIWIICIVMAVGFLAGLFVWVMAIVNPDTSPNQITSNKAMEEYMKQIEKEEADNAAMSLNYEVFGGYELLTFDADSVSELVVETLREGDGDIIAVSDTISAYYTGWTPSGTIFDSTKSIDSENEVRSFSLTQVITGWTNGLAGKKVGGVYQLTIPSAMAYGEYGMGTIIPPNTPLRFVVEVVSKE